jgi:hypothetical protein
MGFRFYRRIKLLFGLRLSVSKSGVSTPVGGRGAWLSFSKRGAYATVGLPGTGSRFTSTKSTRASVGLGSWLIVLALILIAVLGLQLDEW